LAFSNGRPSVIDYRVKPDANVYPMIPSGGSVDDLIRCDQ
jgi:thiamine pyrophosphate-dependent acetolactate synthase large subunit-like protein